MDITNLIYILSFVLFFISLIVSLWVNWAFSSADKHKNSLGLTGKDFVEKLNSITGLNVEPVLGSGKLTDYYDPRTDIIKLSPPVYSHDTIGAIGIAAHEYGHALQKHSGYFWLNLRSLMVPIVSFGTNLGTWLFFIGLLFGFIKLALLGLILFGFAVIFTFITLPVEINASLRGIKLLKEMGLDSQELKYVNKILFAAALTYVASFLMALVNFVYMLSLLGKRD